MTDTLRNLAENDENRPEFLSDDLIDQLTFILKYFTDKTHEDLMKNIVRLLRYVLSFLSFIFVNVMKNIF